MHLRTGRLCPETERDAFVRLDVEDQRIRRRLFSLKNQVRRPFEANGDFDSRSREAFAGSQIKWHAAPAPVIDEKLQGHKSLRRGIGFYPRLLPISGDRFAFDRSGTILAPHCRSRNGIGLKWPDRLQNLDFFVANRSGVKSRWRFHADQRSELQYMALDHVAHRAG